MLLDYAPAVAFKPGDRIVNFFPERERGKHFGTVMPHPPEWHTGQPCAGHYAIKWDNDWHGGDDSKSEVMAYFDGELLPAPHNFKPGDRVRNTIKTRFGEENALIPATVEYVMKDHLWVHYDDDVEREGPDETGYPLNLEDAKLLKPRNALVHQKFWMIMRVAKHHNPTPRRPLFRHGAWDAVNEEAERLALANPGETFIILEAMKMVGTPKDKPVISHQRLDLRKSCQ